MFWHSSAHVLGESAEKHYGCHLCIGPPTDDGFFYEMAIDGRAVTNADYPVLEKLSEGAIKEKQKFERIVVPKETLLKMFEVGSVVVLETLVLTSAVQYNKYKKHLIETKIPDGTSTTVYRCGPMIDLCVGPHIPHTGKIKAFMVTKVSSQMRSWTKIEVLTTKMVSRILPRTSSVIRTTIRCREFTVSRSPIRNNSRSIRLSSPRLPGETTGKLERCADHGLGSWIGINKLP